MLPAWQLVRRVLLFWRLWRSSAHWRLWRSSAHGRAQKGDACARGAAPPIVAPARRATRLPLPCKLLAPSPTMPASLRDPPRPCSPAPRAAAAWRFAVRADSPRAAGRRPRAAARAPLLGPLCPVHAFRHFQRYSRKPPSSRGTFIRTEHGVPLVRADDLAHLQLHIGRRRARTQARTCTPSAIAAHGPAHGVHAPSGFG